MLWVGVLFVECGGMGFLANFANFAYRIRVFGGFCDILDSLPNHNI